MYQGFYINLARNEERRKALIDHLEQVGVAWRYRRFEAVDGRVAAQQYPTKLDPGNLGLWLTHAKLLEANRETKVHLHVIEDDTIFAAGAVNHFDLILERADANYGNWDLIFTDVHLLTEEVTFFFVLARIMKTVAQTTNIALLNLDKLTFACTSSFFLNSKSVEKYAALIANQWTLGYPIDVFIRDMVKKGALKAYLTVPFQTSVSPGSQKSDIRGDLDCSRAVDAVYRRAFFQDADLAALNAEMQELVEGATLSPLADLYLKALRFKLSDRWVPF
jgi:GR25 family glycosyltransferase involved in LPS biosynthesis